MNQSSHNNFICIAKAIGIILVVVGHSRGIEYVDRFIYFFHMPLFFVCSGYFFNDNTDFLSVVKKRFLRLYIPYFKWCVAVLLLHNIFYDLHMYNQEFGINHFSSDYFHLMDFRHSIGSLFIFMDGDQTRILGGFWFIKELFFGSLIVALLICALKKIKCLNRHTSYFIIIFFILISIICRYADINFPIIENVSLLSLSMAFYLIGYVWRKYEIKNIYNIRTACICGGLLLLLSFIWDEPSMFVPYYLIIPYSLIAIIGIMMVLSLAHLIDKRNPSTLLYYIGNSTLTILALHMLVFKFVSLIKIQFYDLNISYLAQYPVTLPEHNCYWWILYSFVGIFIPIFIKFIYEKTISFCHHTSI